jgi:hypothetical protein
MNTLEKIRQVGTDIAFENEIFGGSEIEEINVDNRIIDDFIERIKMTFLNSKCSNNLTQQVSICSEELLCMYMERRRVYFFFKNLQININHKLRL